MGEGLAFPMVVWCDLIVNTLIVTSRADCPVCPWSIGAAPTASCQSFRVVTASRTGEGTLRNRSVRLRIKGEITPEQLVKAFEVAMKELEAAVPGGKFYGASLYLTPYDPDGERLTAFDEGGSPAILTVPAQPGTNVKPALSAAAQQRRDDAREAQRQREIQQAERDRKEVAEYNRKRQIQAVQLAKARTAFNALNELTSKLLTSEPEGLIDGLNEAIRASWHNQEPKEPHGPRKGELKPEPEFSIVDGKLSLFTASWKNPKPLFNPIGTLNLNLNTLAPVWTHSAWMIAIEGFLNVMEHLNGSLPDEIFGEHLPQRKAAD